MIFFRSSALYHATTPWTAPVMQPEDKFTPGRIAFVWFNCKEINAMLEKKGPGWIRKTGGVELDNGTKLSLTELSRTAQASDP